MPRGSVANRMFYGKVGMKMRKTGFWFEDRARERGKEGAFSPFLSRYTSLQAVLHVRRVGLAEIQ